MATPPNLFLSLLPPTYYVSSISIGGVEKSLGPIYGNAILTPHTDVHFMLCPTHHSHELEKTTTMNILDIHHKSTPNSPPLSILPGVCSSIAAARCRQQEAGERQEAVLGIRPASKHHCQPFAGIFIEPNPTNPTMNECSSSRRKQDRHSLLLPTSTSMMRTANMRGTNILYDNTHTCDLQLRKLQSHACTAKTHTASSNILSCGCRISSCSKFRYCFWLMIALQHMDACVFI